MPFHVGRLRGQPEDRDQIAIAQISEPNPDTIDIEKKPSLAQIEKGTCKSAGEVVPGPGINRVKTLTDSDGPDGSRDLAAKCTFINPGAIPGIAANLM